MFIHSGASWDDTRQDGGHLMIFDSGVWWIGTWGKIGLPVYARVREVVKMPQPGMPAGVLPIQGIQLVTDSKMMVKGDTYLGTDKEALIGVMMVCLN